MSSSNGYKTQDIFPKCFHLSVTYAYTWRYFIFVNWGCLMVLLSVWHDKIYHIVMACFDVNLSKYFIINVIIILRMKSKWNNQGSSEYNKFSSEHNVPNLPKMPHMWLGFPVFLQISTLLLGWNKSRTQTSLRKINNWLLGNF